ncbi:MAG: radical SAM protein [Salinivirgaceae bacterium]|nr:radical SAM protein [Salinivirgaceae bacterium]
MFFSPVSYHQPVFRPPGEANSVIIQATLGCSWNACSFCEMYTSKTFKVRNPAEVFADIQKLSQHNAGAKKIFLADGNAFVLSSKKLMALLDQINTSFGRIQRVSSYALPKDISNKSLSELQELQSQGLKLLYIGIETGDDELLKLINKSETYNSTVDGILKAQQAGIDTSIMILNGIGGKEYSEQHALNSAKIINEINPKFLSTLTLSLPYGLEHFQNKFKGNYQQQSITELYKELKLFIEKTKVDNVIYRSDHVSNNLILKGILSKDNDKLVSTIEKAIANTSENQYPSAPEVL